jgi:SAM-dependent methyltransferase
MLEIARKKAADAGLGIRLREGDITNISLHETYDAVIALFAVMGLQTSGDALASALQTIKAALACGGIFLFDCWNGYAVEHDRLATRHKEVDAGDGVKIARLSLAEIEATEQIVHVGMKLRHTRGNEITETAESQSVKYFYPEQIRHILTVAGFQDIDIHPFLSPDAVLTAKDWSMMVAAR